MYKELGEQELARYCSRGDRSAEDELYRRYAARVFTLCRRYLADSDEAKDMMQDVLIRALDKIQSFTFRGPGSLYGWISRIAINTAINHLKRQRWRIVRLEAAGPDGIPEPAEQEMEEIPQEKLLEWIAQLPDMQRTIFNMYCIDGYTHRQIGEMLGISEKGSSGELARARKQLKEKIREYLKEKER